MLSKIAKILGLSGDDDNVADPNFSDIALASAALMLEVALTDGDVADAEIAQLRASLATHYSLDAATIERLESEARIAVSGAVDLYAFTRPLAKALDQEQRQDIIRLMWQVALADDHLDNFEENILAKVAGLLGVSTADRVRLKQEVVAERG